VDEATRFLIEYGLLLVFAWVFLDQAGFPVPAIPALLAAGALVGEGHMALAPLVAVATLACLPSDLIWYQIGRHRGASVLRLLCKISLEPDSCVRNTEEVFARHGARSLLVAKFVPGYQTVAPPMAGMLRMRLGRFLLFDTLGAFLWAVAFILPGVVFHAQLGEIATLAAGMGRSLFLLLALVLAGYIGWKFFQRQRFIRSLRIARISPAELKSRMDGGEPVHIVDLRHSLEFEAEPVTLPGANRMAVEEIEGRHDEIPRDRDIVLYCT